MQTFKCTDNKLSYSAILVLLHLRLRTLHGVRNTFVTVQAEMAESEVMQAAIKAAIVAVMVLQEGGA